MREEYSRLREPEQTLPRRAHLARHQESQEARMAAKLHRARGTWVERRWGDCQGQVNPTSASYSSVTRNNFLSFRFLICKILFTFLGIVRTERSSSAVPASNHRSLSTNYYCYQPQHHHRHVNLRIHLWLTHQGVEIMSFILDK